jgi:hypothetical protein
VHLHERLAERQAQAGALLGLGVLAQAPAPSVAADLVGRILAAAPEARRRLAWLLPAGLGVGLATACAAGLVLGVQLSRSVIEDQAVTTAIAEDSLYADEAA